MTAKRIVLDLDGVVAELRRPGQNYADLAPVPGAVDAIRALKRAGHYLILSTARHMKTCEGNVGRVIVRQGKVTLEWLARHGIEVDEIHFGKPFADIYVDDCAVRFTSWAALGSTIPGLELKTPRQVPTGGLSAQSDSNAYAPPVLVMPLAGRSGRFVGSRFTPETDLPAKGLIDVAGRSMIWWALASLRGVQLSKIVFVVLGKHSRGPMSPERLRMIVASLVEHGLLAECPVEIVVQEDFVAGQLLSILRARVHLAAGRGLIVAGGDTYVDTDLEQAIGGCGIDVAGLISVVETEGDRWSFARTDARGDVVEVAEKKRISDLAGTGIYYFRDGAEFLDLADAHVASGETTNGEHYVMPLYSEYFRRGRRVIVARARAMHDMGTPAALEEFLHRLRDSVVPTPAGESPRKAPEGVRG